MDISIVFYLPLSPSYSFYLLSKLSLRNLSNLTFKQVQFFTLHFSLFNKKTPLFPSPPLLGRGGRGVRFTPPSPTPFPAFPRSPVSLP